MRDLLRTAALPLLALVAGFALARSCSTPPPVVVPDPDEIRRIEEDREREREEHARQIQAAVEEAQALRELDLYARVEALVPPAAPNSEASKSARKVAKSLMATDFEASKQPAAERCTPASPGYALCPEPVLDRLTLRLVDEIQRADVAEIRLDEERAYRLLDAERWAVEREAFARAKPAPAWKLPTGIVGGAALATGIALAVAGSEEAGAVVGGVGLVAVGVAIW